MNQAAIGQYIAGKRTAQGMTQEQLAQRVGVSAQAVSKWEAGQTMPDLPKLERDGIQAATHFVESTLSVEPAAERAPFHGRIWVLVGPAVYSASESFAVFCQETGFATLVGSPTGGDGIGALDPVFLQLPNSGILVQFTMMFGLNADGSSSEEAGTTPDLLSPGTEPPLITVLRAIRETA